MFAETPDPPYTAVIFTSLRAGGDDREYAEMAAQMDQRAAACAGFLGVESARGADGLGITVSYWASRDAAEAFRRDSEHLVAQKLGRDRWYLRYVLRVCQVNEERTYSP